MPILFLDLDDTVLDRQSTLLRWATWFAEEQGLGESAVAQIVEEDHGGYRQRDEFAAALRTRFGLADPADGPAFMADFISLFRCTDDVTAALRKARARGWKLAIVTNGGGPAQTGKIRASGLGSLVDAVCISQLEGVAKPDPKLFEIAAARLDMPLEGWMIGDNPANDIGGAAAAGLSSVWLRLNRTWDLTTHRPTHEADSFCEAVDLVLNGRAP